VERPEGLCVHLDSEERERDTERDRESQLKNFDFWKVSLRKRVVATFEMRFRGTADFTIG
jgi:hypothetical protein